MDFQEAMERQMKQCLEQHPDLESSPDGGSGDAFEDLCKHYLENGPWGKTSGAAVWKWKNSGNPLRLNAKDEKDRLPQDTGCDLVAQTPDGGYYVIQCKYYPNSTLTLDEAHLANIAALAQRYHIPQNHVIFCYVAKSVSSQAESVLSHYTCIREDDLDNPDFDWGPMFEEKRKASKSLRDYQKEAIEACVDGFKAEEYEGKRQVGKLIMACGTGKTFTALGLAKKLSEGKPYTVLFMAPSIALVSQTFQAWALEEDISPLIVCSDSTAGTGKGTDEDEMDETVSDISSPDVTTDAEEMARKWEKIEGQNKVLRVVFSTYQSIEAVREFQEKTGVKFDLTICDEAHRTASHEGSLFSLAAEPNYIDTVKKLFMTATPKIYSGAVQDKAKDEYATVLYSMDDEEKYGPEFFRFGFGEAVDKEVLCDYRVLILAMRKGAEELEDIQSLVKGTEAAKTQIEKLQREINKARNERTRALAEKDRVQFEKKLTTLAGKIQGAYIDLSDLKASNQGEVYRDFDGRVAFKEIGSGTASESPSEKHFAHSAIGFANSIQNSKIITQALSSPDFPGKDPKIECRHIDGTMNSDMRLEDLIWLKQGQKNDEIRLITNAQCLSEGVDIPNLDAVVFFEKRQSQIGIIQAIGRVMRKADKKEYGYIILPIMLSEGETPEDSDEYGAIWQILQSMRSVDERLDAQINTLALARKAAKKAKGKKKQGEVDELQEKPHQPSLFDEDMQRKLVSYILSKCGSSMYWKDWVGNISGSVKNMINEIDELADSPEIKPKFEEFTDNLSKTLHKDQTKEDAINLIAQFIVTRPIFRNLFPSSDFDSNPISRALESIADDFKDAYSTYNRELGELQFSMEQAANAVTTDPAARKRLVKNFYEKFYKQVFPNDAKDNGIVYTPEPVVDFMIKETDRLLQRNFGKRLQDEGVQILDPFSGTGTFVTRLLDKGLGVIDDDHIGEKYEKGIWANEIMSTAYYISTLNIEDVMKQRSEDGNIPFPGSFPGGVLTDTFNMDEDRRYGRAPLFSANNDREERENSEDISAIISNPPYYRKAEDKYGYLLAPYKTAGCNNNDGYNNLSTVAYIWASNRINKGIISFITPNTLLSDYAFETFREKFVREFSDIYVLNLRGDKNKDRSREFKKKEGDPIFPPEGGVSGKAIIFLVKNPDCNHQCRIHYVATEDFATRDDKFDFLTAVKQTDPEWKEWLSSNGDPWNDNDNETTYIPLGRLEQDKVDAQFVIFNSTGRGIKAENAGVTFAISRQLLIDKISPFTLTSSEQLKNPKIGYRALFDQLKKKPLSQIDPSEIKLTAFKPFIKAYYYAPLISRYYSQNNFFPTKNDKNLEICIGTPKAGQISCLMTKLIPARQFLGSEIMGLPLYVYKDIFGDTTRTCTISDDALNIFREAYPDHDVLSAKDEEAKRQIFYYVYGLFNSDEYKELLRTSLKGSSYRIPLSSHFKEFEKAGRELATFHVGYEEAPKSKDVMQVGEPIGEIEKMNLDEGVLTVNRYLSFKNIPQEAFNYTIDGRSPLEWVVNQYKKTPDIEYVCDLIPRLVTVSVKTQEIVKSLPQIDRLTSMDFEIERIWGTK